MRKIGIIAVLSLMALALAAVPALADNPHFIGTPTATTNNSGALLVSFKEAGLGTISATSVTANAQASATYVCVNGGGKNPSAANKRTITAPVTGGGDFPVRHGQTTGTITIQPPSAGTFTCPPGQRLALASVTYSGITVTGEAGTVATNPSTVSFTDTSVPQ